MRNKQANGPDHDSGRWSPKVPRAEATMVRNFTNAQEVNEIIHILQHSAEHDELMRALHELMILFADRHKRKDIEDNHLHLSVISTMDHMIGDIELQMLGLDILHRFIVHSPVMQEKMWRKLDVFNQVLKLLSHNPSNTQLQAKALRVLIRLLVSDIRDLISHNRLWHKLMEVIMNVINSSSNDVECVENCLMVLSRVLREERDLQKLLAEKHLQAILQLFKAYAKYPDVVKNLLFLLKLTAQSEGVHATIGPPTLSVIMSYLPQWHPDPSITKDCFSLMDILSANDKVSALLVEKGFVTNTLLSELITHPDNYHIQESGLNIFLHTAEILFCNACEEAANEWLKIIYIAMGRHMAHPVIQACGCRALCKLLECKPEVYMWIGESSELKQDPLHTLCLGAILMYEKNEEVFEAACRCIYYLTADNDGLCKSLMDKNSHMAIIEGLRCHVRSTGAICAACRAIRGLSIFQNEHKLEIGSYDGDVLPLLVEIIKKYPGVAEVQSEVISTIACLADVDLLRHQCYVVGAHLRIIEAMDNFPGDEFLQETAVEALAVLGGAVSGSEILNSNGAIDKIIKCLKRFLHNSNIQKKGLWAIQILAESKLVQSTVMCKELASLIKSTMKTYPDFLVIQKEAIVAMQILAERGVEGERRDHYSNMAEVLVDQECHELLFQILEKFDDDQGLHDLASECLYVIGIEQDLKSRMLLSACLKGFITGAECLVEVGADVNIGQGTETPLYYAVRNNNENMVRFLLRQEVRDVQTSLKLSLDKGYDRITGMLLSHIGQDRETGTVMWANFSLGDLSPEWIMPTLLGEDRQPHSSSKTSKRFVAQIKHSEMRRNMRLHQSPSDSNLEFIRNKCFRYRHSTGEVPNNAFEAIHELQALSPPEEIPKRPSTVPPRSSSRRLIRRRILGRDLTIMTDQDKETVDLSLLSSPSNSVSSLEGLPPSIDAHDAPMFEHSEDEWEDWKKTTLSGANIPFSPADPRRPSDPSKIQEVVQKFRNAPGKWQRKFSTRETHRMRSNSLNRSGNVSRSSSLGDSGAFVRMYSDSISTMATYDPLSSDSEAVDSRRSSMQSGLSAEDTDFDISVDDQKASKQHEQLIRSLDISANQISSLDHLVTGGEQLLQCFATLEFLDLSGNELNGLPEELFKSLTSLKCLSLNHNNLTEFPSSVGNCSNLLKLDLASNQTHPFQATLRSKPSGNPKECISNASFDTPKPLSIAELNLSDNGIKEFPASLDKTFPHLSKLDISRNSIQILPTEGCNMCELRCLDLSHNTIHIVPDEFLIKCIKLETLIAVDNGLEILPHESVAEVLTRLSTVKLRKNDITEKEPFCVPKFILELPNLRTVDLSNNGLVGFPPPSMWRSQILKDIIMSKNNISKLNLDGARQWSKLEKLHLSNNKIVEVPREIGQLSSLQSLDLSYNRSLTTLPDELGRCARLWEMPLEGLSLDLDDALLRGRVKDLTIYLHNRLKKAQRYYRMKLMVVGYGGKGKTSLLQALKRKIKHNAPEKPAVTVGVIVDDWRYERQRFGKTVTYTLNTWDFAGQEDFYSTHQCFLSNRTLYLVVYDISMGTDEIDALKPWLSNIHARAPGCPVIVVGTHYDVLPIEERDKIVAEFEVKLKELMHKPGFPAITCFAIVDLTKETPELEQLRKKVKDTVDEFKIKGQPVMGQKVPASYVRLGDLLHEETKKVEKSFPVIRHGQLLRLIRMENLDLDEDEELKQAINFLHESGVLLHYNETALQMRDFYFINPGWLCRMMAQVVTVPEINPFIDRNGIMKRSAAHMLFTGKETTGHNNFVFPQTLIPQYLHLLEKFEIALPRNQEELLIPSRLPYRRPNFELPVQDRADLVVRYYVMPYTPIGFWSRLLTRLIVFSESKFAENMLYLQEKPQVQFWKEGIYVKWSPTAFLLVEGCKGSHDEIHMKVPNTVHGCRLLGHLIDHADSLVDEWYPGLTAIDPLLGRELLEKFVPCTLCKDAQTHLFRFEDLLKESENNTEVYCSQHEGMVDLVSLAPDIMLADIEPHFHLDLDQFEFNESLENLCGDGGFGSVYKAKYKGKTVAVKVFSAIGDIHPHKMLRQEATILRRLKHPSVIALVAVAVRPVRLVVMEFAPSKSLGEVFRSGQHLSRTLQLKICLQVSEGLEYLHSLMIIYRDLKPDNVLIFTLAPDALINAKIADYGISQFTTLFGLTAQEGTPAYRAPEVIRGETYSFQADIFSLGILMYMILTGGIHPFDELEFKSEIDKAFAENYPIPPVTKRGCPPWPDFQELLSQCLNQVPDYRPTAYEVFDRLSSAELFSLREVLPVSVGTTVECMTSQTLDIKHVRLWVASGDNEYMQLTWLNLLDYRDDSLHPDRTRQSVDYSGMGTMFRDGRVLCILPINKQCILLGTQAGKIWVFNTHRNVLEHSTRQLTDSVLSLFLIQSRGDDPLVLAGLANGKVALYPMSEILQEPDMTPIEMKLGEDYEPVRCISRSSVDKKIIASCGTKIVVMITRRGVAVESRFDTVDGSNPASPAIICMACSRHLYIAHHKSSILEAWDTGRGRLKYQLDISSSFNLPDKDSRITSMVLHEKKTLWIGTGGGQIVLVDVNNWTPIISTHRHTASIRSLMVVKLKSTIKYGPNSSTTVILSGGLGFRNTSECDMDKDDQYGCIGVWDADFPQTVKQFTDWSKKRKELHDISRKPTTL